MIDKKKLAEKLGIARSTLYYKSKLKVKDEVIRKETVEIMDSNPAYGYRRGAIALNKNHKPIQRIMANNGLKPPCLMLLKKEAACLNIFILIRARNIRAKNMLFSWKNSG